MEVLQILKYRFRNNRFSLTCNLIYSEKELYVPPGVN